VRRIQAALVVGLSAILAACSSVPKPPVMAKQAVYPARTTTQLALNDLPPPTRPLAVAVYGFSDQTGQFKPTDTGQTLSRAVSQGGSSMLIRSLQAAGSRKWFTIVAREQFKDLLNERQIILEMRQRYLGETQVNPEALPSLLFAGVLLEGGVIGYDTNTQTGGAGAALLGIGASTKYRQDTVTVYLQAVSVRTGEILTSVTASKTITSYAVDASIFRYVAADKVLETEGGFTTNEPGQMALQQAIDKAVYGLIMEGVDLKLWAFSDPIGALMLLDNYHAERDGRVAASTAESLVKKAHKAAQSARARGPVLAAVRTPPAPANAAPGFRSSVSAAAVSNFPPRDPREGEKAATQSPTSGR
jgi:curli production assembly/transport component CsgG